MRSVGPAADAPLRECWCVCVVVLLQENVKARHPQLLYESKLYKILQGGGESDGCAQQEH